MRAVPAPIQAALAAVALAALAGCTPQPLLDPAAPTPPLALVPVADAGISDGRARFREILCRLNEHHGAALPDHRPCEDILHRLPGEARPGGRAVNLEHAAAPLRLVVVGDSCPRRPLDLAARHVEQLGYEAGWVDAGPPDAAAIRKAVAELADAGERPIVLLGYSGGIGVVLDAISDPAAARHVVAVVSLGGAVNGSPLAERPEGPPLAMPPGQGCAPGAPDAVESLRRVRRTGWLATRRLPPAVRYYSLASFAARERIAPPLRPGYDALALIEPRNDGRLLAYDQLLPQSTLLGYLNADHWAIALPLVRDQPALAATNAFPRELVLEAILKHIEEDLLGLGREKTGDEPEISTV